MHSSATPNTSTPQVSDLEPEWMTISKSKASGVFERRTESKQITFVMLTRRRQIDRQDRSKQERRTNAKNRQNVQHHISPMLCRKRTDGSLDVKSENNKQEGVKRMNDIH